MNPFFWRKPQVKAYNPSNVDFSLDEQPLVGTRCPNWECHAQEEHTVARLRERTHEISEYWQEYAGALERENKRYRRALQRSLAVIGTNLDERGPLRHTPGVNDFTQDIQYIHGLVPEFKYLTYLAYSASSGARLSPDREALIGIISGKENE